MPWTSPRTWVTGEVETASIFNQHIRDNLTFGGNSHDHTGESGDGADLTHFAVLMGQLFTGPRGEDD